MGGVTNGHFPAESLIVDLPQPLLPTTAVVLPARMSKVIPDKTSNCGSSASIWTSHRVINRVIQNISELSQSKATGAQLSSLVPLHPWGHLLIMARLVSKFHVFEADANLPNTSPTLGKAQLTAWMMRKVAIPVDICWLYIDCTHMYSYVLMYSYDIHMIWYSYRIFDKGSMARSTSMCLWLGNSGLHPLQSGNRFEW